MPFPDQNASVISYLGLMGPEGVYSLQTSLIETLTADINVYLKELNTGRAIDLLNNQSIEVVLADQREQQFELIFEKVEILSNPSLVSSILIYGNEPELTIGYPSSRKERLRVYNLAGRKLLDVEIQFKNNLARVRFEASSNEIYLVKIGQQSAKFRLRP